MLPFPQSPWTVLLQKCVSEGARVALCVVPTCQVNYGGHNDLTFILEIQRVAGVLHMGFCDISPTSTEALRKE